MSWKSTLLRRQRLVSMSAIAAALVSFFQSGQSLAAEPPREAHKYLRLLRDEQGQPVALQTATVHLTSPRGDLQVDLIGAVHIADQAYYEALNKQFADYDAVLYELVAPPGTRIPQGGRAATDPISTIQQMARKVLGLQSQADHIDYTRANLVHADMSPQEMMAALEARGDNLVTFALSAAADVMRQANREVSRQSAESEDAEAHDFDLWDMLTDPHASVNLKVELAEQFGNMAALESGLGPAVHQLLIADRNAAAMRVLQQQLAAGRCKLAIFYGAAHLADFERRLVAEYDLQRRNTTWLTAWDLKPGSHAAPQPLSLWRQLLAP